MKFGMGVLGLSPTQFWTMTPRELSAAYNARREASGDNTPIGRDDMANLMQKYPDDGEKKQ